MDAEQHIPTVLEKLMGLDELQPQQPVRRQQKVLSEEYLLKTASIGLLRKRSYKQREHEDVHELPKILKKGRHNIGSVPEAKASLTANWKKVGSVWQDCMDVKCLLMDDTTHCSMECDDMDDLDSNEDIPGKYVQEGTSFTKPNSRLSIIFNYQSNKKFSRPGKTTTKENIFRLCHKLEYSRRLLSLPVKLRDEELHFPKRIVACGTYQGVSASLNRSSFLFSFRSDGRRENFTSTRRGMPFSASLFDQKYKNQARDRRGSFSSQTPNSKVRVDGIHENEPELATPCAGLLRQKNKNQASYTNESVYSREERKQFVERWRLKKFGPEVETGRSSCTTGEMLSAKNLVERPKTEILSCTGCSRINHPMGINCKEGCKNKFISSTPRSKSFHEIETKRAVERVPEENLLLVDSSCGKSLCSDMDYDSPILQGTVPVTEQNVQQKMYENSASHGVVLDSSILVSVHSTGDKLAEDAGISLEDTSKQQCVPTTCNLYVEDGNSSLSSDASSGQESPNRSHEYEYSYCTEVDAEYSNCTEVDAEFPVNVKEASQPSPNSVLEPFKEDDSPESKCYGDFIADLNGLWLQLQLLKSKSDEETGSNGTGMVVSNDEDCTEKSFHCKIKSAVFFPTEEIRDSSYLSDVLENSFLRGGNSESSFGECYSPEYPLSASIFEALEKKYSEQTMWSKAERKFLFDRINEGLMKILKPCIDMHISSKPLRKKMSTSLRRDVIEEELWKLMVSQEKEASKELLKKAVGEDQWFELADDIDDIVRDVEKFLFDELVEEIFSI